MTRLVVVGLALALAIAVGTGCAKEGCLGGEDGCRVPPPCQKVAFTCSGGDSLSVETITDATQRPGGWNGIGAKGDVKLSNGVVDVVIAGIGTQTYLDPHGGSILDLAPAGQPKDTVNNVFQVVGILPNDAAWYSTLEIIDERPARVAVQVRGTLDGRPNVPISTRYELTPCDPGVRVRTEIVNGSTDNQTWGLLDGYYWSGRESLPFAPGEGEGFTHMSFGLTTIQKAFKTFPYFAAAGHSGDGKVSAISTASCTDPKLTGFHSDQISAAGLGLKVVPPRGSLIFERFIAAADVRDVGGAIDLALEVRKQVLGEAYVTLTGTVERMGGGGGFAAEREASVLVVEGALGGPTDAGIPWTQVVPKADGTFSVRVPGNKQYVVEVHAFGRKEVERQFSVGATDQSLGAFVLPGVATLTATVQDATTMMPIDAELFVVPETEESAAALTGNLHGRFATCSPWLGPPPGASPACNRILVRNGQATAEVPTGRYEVLAFHGPFWSLGREVVNLQPGNTSLSFSLTRLPLKPAGALSSDLHVHGAASFDSSIPDLDRVLSFSASDLDVIVATDHDVIYDYGKIVADLGLSGRMSTVVGLESTGHIPWLKVKNYGFPLVIGHYNLWPLRFDPSLPRNGAPIDELIEPGELFERTKSGATGLEVIELNHPWAEPEFGRDLGFPRAIFLDTTKDLPATDDGSGTGANVYIRTPANASYANDGHHAQEVINGSDSSLHLQYRAFWFYVLNQGRLKAGTANSDSHSLTDNTVGVPQNLVFTSTTAGPGFDVNAFNTAVREGRMIGTNGPVISATVEDATGQERGPSLLPFAPKADGVLRVKVSSAPWIPVEEVRVVVNGVVVKTFASLPQPTDPFATSGDLVRFDGTAPLTELLSGVSGDAWIVVEAGTRLPLAADLGGGLDLDKDGKEDLDGIPDTTDNNGDGKVDSADVTAGEDRGPLNNLPTPKRGEVGYYFGALTGGHPNAFANPFVLDRNGDGKFNAPGVTGGR
ncbi:MAG: CehA/McbA family metallohydrolase [Myxococcota bacterium]